VRAREQGLPFILMSNRSDSASVREALPLHPTAYLSKPLNLETCASAWKTCCCRRRADCLPGAGAAAGPAVGLPRAAPRNRRWRPAVRRRAGGDQARPQPEGLNLKVLEEEVRNDPQITGVLIAAANSAAMHRDAPVQTLMQALNKLGSTQSMNLILGLTLKRSAR
jgi:CheY-like chemotaxis protein